MAGKLSKTDIDAAQAPATGQGFLWDGETKGFGLRISAGGRKTFILQRRIKGREKRITLGAYPEITVEQARKLALAHIGEIAKGGDPVAQKAAETLQAKTLREVIADYLASGKLKRSTEKDLQTTLGIHCTAWMDKPVTSIGRDTIAKLHARVGKEINETTGKPKQATANKLARYLKALMNYAADTYRTADGQPIMQDNPVAVLKKRMYKVARRTGHLEPHQIAAWWAATEALQDSWRDYLRTMLLTGLRANEALHLRWADVDLAGRTLTVRNTKNGTDHSLPMGEWLTAMLTARPRRDAYVFTGEKGLPTNRRYGIDKVAEATGLDIQRHDLRRSFLTVADAVDVPYFALKALANHKSGSGGDITAGYIQHSIARLKRPVQAIEDFILSAAGVRSSAVVLPMHGGAEAIKSGNK
ncbi:site-specific integrase [Acidithiobacillus sp. YTS05]|nr:site-specific integrase [Acidithiobacillus sp. YTS05]